MKVKVKRPFNRMTRGRGDTGTRGDKPQGSSSLIKICDLMAPDWWAPQAPTTSVSGASPPLRVSASLLELAKL